MVLSRRKAAEAYPGKDVLMSTTLTKEQFEFLRSIDTPTVCNLIEMVAPERRGMGYTIKHLHCPFPDLPPMVGFAKTVTIKTRDKVALGEASYMAKRLDYLDYVAGAPAPSIVVIEDLDGEHAGFGAFWGEVQSNLHKALGCLGTITNGSIRDIPQIPPASRCSPARSRPRTPMCMSRTSASPSRCTAWRWRAAISSMPTATAPSSSRSRPSGR
jgi:regulator of RNase E activity RraA